MIIVPDEANLTTEEKMITPMIVANFAVWRDGNNVDVVSFNESLLDALVGIAWLRETFSKLLSTFSVVEELSNSLLYIQRNVLTPIAHNAPQMFWIAKNVLAATNQK